ncbi:hypothetical protein [Planotetraspora silvatica]|nr:hypothetical protein [Planotetraspora silvatica]
MAATRPDGGVPSGTPARPFETTFRILFVCTGNVCRSPMAEGLARAMLGPGSPLVVASAGIRSEPGRPMTERARRAVVKLGGEPHAAFASRRLTPDLVAGADLVLGAGVRHRAESVAMHPAAAAHAFTIAEFGALAAAVHPWRVVHLADPVERMRALVAEVRAQRGLILVDQPDIPDPNGRSRRRHREAGRRIAEALNGPFRLLTAAVPESQASTGVLASAAS